MSWGWALFTYFVVWWLTLFCVLPVGAKPPDKPSPQHYAAAPEFPNLRRKMLWNCVISAIVVLLIHLLLKSGIVPLRDAIP